MRRSNTPSQHLKTPFISRACPPPNPNITLRPLHLLPSPIKSCCFSNVIASFHAPMWGNYTESPDCIFISEGENGWLHKATWYLYFSACSIFSCLNLISLKFTVENPGHKSIKDKSNSFSQTLDTFFSSHWELSLTCPWSTFAHSFMSNLQSQRQHVMPWRVNNSYSQSEHRLSKAGLVEAGLFIHVLTKGDN